MGQGQSNPRRITVINDEAAGVIKISDSVVQRLKEEMSSSNSGGPQRSETTAPPPPSPSPPPPPAPEQHQQHHQPPQPPPNVRYSEEQSMSALRVRAEKEAELRQVESYWQNRVQKLREHQLKSKEVDEEAFRSTVAEIDKMFLKSRNQPVCQELRHSVLQCYQQNQKQSLLCAEQVKAFANCVESARLGSLGRNG